MAGRPIEYTDQIALDARKYLDSCEDEIIQTVSGESEKFTTYKEKVRVKLPSIEGLAFYLKISKDTIYRWEKEYSLFSDVINDLRGKQAERLINMGLSGDYNAYIAKALLAKHGYHDKQEIDHTTKGDKIETPIINVYNQAPPIAEDETQI
jgi:hypothetical protein